MAQSYEQQLRNSLVVDGQSNETVSGDKGTRFKERPGRMPDSDVDLDEMDDLEKKEKELEIVRGKLARKNIEKESYTDALKKIIGISKVSEKKDEKGDEAVEYERVLGEYFQKLMNKEGMSQDTALARIMKERIEYRSAENKLKIEKNPKFSKFKNFWNNRLNEFHSLSPMKKRLYGALLMGTGLAIATYGSAVVGTAFLGTRLLYGAMGSASVGFGVKMLSESKYQKKEEENLKMSLLDHEKVNKSENPLNSPENIKADAMRKFLNLQSGLMSEKFQEDKFQGFKSNVKGFAAGAGMMGLSLGMRGAFSIFSETEAGKETGQFFSWLKGKVLGGLTSLGSEVGGKEITSTVSIPGEKRHGFSGGWGEEKSVISHDHVTGHTMISDDPDEIVIPNIKEPLAEDPVAENQAISQGEFLETSPKVSNVPTIETLKTPIIPFSEVANAGSPDDYPPAKPITSFESVPEIPVDKIIPSELGAESWPEFDSSKEMRVLSNVGISPAVYSKEVMELSLEDFLKKYPDSVDFRENIGVIELTSSSGFDASESEKLKLADLIRKSMEGKIVDPTLPVGQFVGGPDMKDIPIDYYTEHDKFLKYLEYSDNFKIQEVEWFRKMILFDSEDWKLIADQEVEDWKSIADQEADFNASREGLFVDIISRHYPQYSPEEGETMKEWTRRIAIKSHLDGQLENMKRIAKDLFERDDNGKYMHAAFK